MRPVLQDILDVFNRLEPRDRWTTAVVFWQDGTMQLTTHSMVVDEMHAKVFDTEKPYAMEAVTTGTISDRTMRRHLRKLEAGSFEYRRGGLFPGAVRRWALKGCLRLVQWSAPEAVDAYLEELERRGIRMSKSVL